MPAHRKQTLTEDETPTLPQRVIPPRLTLPMVRATQRERDEAAAGFALFLKLQGFTPEYQFARPYRRWRLDHARLDLMIAVEIEGGQWSSGRHVRPLGFYSDCIKYNHAALCGWVVLRFTIDHILNGYAMQTVETALAQAKARSKKGKSA